MDSVFLTLTRTDHILDTVVDLPIAGPASQDAPLDEPRFTVEHGLAARIAHAAVPVLADLGHRLVWVKLSAGPPGLLRIMAERRDGTFTIGDCEAVSRALSPVLDLEDPIAGEYRLEVSSPGIDRPLVRLSDLRRAAGHEVKVELSVSMGGRRRFRGSIAEVHDDGRVVLALIDAKASDPGTVEIPVRDIGEARLVLTDALIRDALKIQDAAAGTGDAPAGDAAPDAGRGPGRFADRNRAKRARPAGDQTRARPAPTPRGR